MKPAFDLRLATNQEGPIVAGLCAANGFIGLDAADWSDIWPHWVVAVKDQAIVGCIQICLGKPVARAEFLAVDPLASHLERAMIVKGLVAWAGRLAAKSGAAYMSGMIGHQNRAFKKVAKRRGAVTMSAGVMMLQKVA